MYKDITNLKLTKIKYIRKFRTIWYTESLDYVKIQVKYRYFELTVIMSSEELRINS